MITVGNISEYMNSICPPELAFNGDNVGLIVGSADKKVKKVLITLDVDEKVVSEAVDINADLIISHHPLMFHPVKRLTSSDPMQRTLMLLVKNDISLFSAHTNLDCVRGGLNDYLALKLGIENTSVIDIVSTNGEVSHGFGRIGELKETVTLGHMLKLCCEALGAEGLRYVGDPERKIRRVAVNCGGGADAMDACISLGADLFVTGDVKYNPARDAYDNNMALIDAGHYETEHIVINLLYDMLNREFGDTVFVRSEANTPVWSYYK